MNNFSGCKVGDMVEFTYPSENHNFEQRKGIVENVAIGKDGCEYATIVTQPSGRYKNFRADKLASAVVVLPQ